MLHSRFIFIKVTFISEWYTFELRGSIFVKGKDNMTTFLLVGRKPDSMVNAVSSIKPVLSQ